MPLEPMSEFHRLWAYLESKGRFTEEEFAFLAPLFLPLGGAGRRIDAVEDSNLFLIDSASHQRAIDWVPGYAAGFCTGLQRAAAPKDRRIVDALSATAD